jgi:hypothetical protein
LMGVIGDCTVKTKIFGFKIEGIRHDENCESIMMISIS